MQPMQIGICILAAALWGLWWIPIRWIGSTGFPEGIAPMAMNLGALPFLAAYAVLSPWRLGVRAMAGAALVGTAIALYGTAVSQTDVVRAVLIFYLAPMWSLLIESVFLGRRLNAINALAIAVSLCGLLLILRGDVSLSGWRRGDMLALLSGMAWSAGSAFVFTDERRSHAALALVACLASIAVAGVFSVHHLPQIAPDLRAVGIVIACALLFHAPILVMTLWAAIHLPPATISFVLTAEIVTGVASSALLLDERFGMPEALGAAMIIGAAVLEVLSARRSAAQRPPE